MKVVWTNTATNSYEEIIDYILKKWTLREATIFFEKTLSIIEKIKCHNEIGKRYKATIYRKFLISKQTYLFHSVRKDEIYINLFWNNQQNPKRLRKILQL